MKILLTGGTGLVGSRLVEALAWEHEVTELRRYVAGRRYDAPQHRVVQYDLRGGGEVPEDDYDVVLHLGAMASNSAANRSPVECFDIIASGTMRLLHALERMGGDPVVILASSSEVYAHEGHRGALNPYAAAKIAAEEAVMASPFSSVIVRPFNTYGRALVGSPVAVIDRWVVQALTGRPITAGDDIQLASVLRDFLWREDHVAGYLELLEQLGRYSGTKGEVMEFGTGEAVSLQQVLDAVLGHFPGHELDRTSFTRPNDVPVLISDPSAWAPGWSPAWTLEEGIERCINEWKDVLK